MIISASRRTDIPAFYSDWFFKRIQEGFVLVRNPMNPHQVSRVPLNRDAVDCIVFWTKNPESMLPKLNLLDGYPFYFQFTVNSYDKGFEPGVPGQSTIVDTFKRLSDVLGPERVIWRYDPVILTETNDVSCHERNFEVLAGKLHDYTSKCIFSFVDYYKKVDRSFRENGITELDEEKKKELAARFSVIIGNYGLKLETCAEEIDLTDLDIRHACCIDPELIEKLSGMRIKAGKDRNQRKACGCCPSVDIGTYNTCLHGCAYCYANHNPESLKRNCMSYDPDSLLLCSKLTNEDKVTEK
jgi:DNA repair photolyase